MIWILLSAMLRPLSVDGGRSRFALGLVDPLGPVVLVHLVLAGRQQGLVGVRRGPAGPQGSGRAILPDDEVPEDLLGDQETPLELEDRRRGRPEHDDVVG